MKLILPLNVYTRKEGYLHLSAYFVVMCLLALSAVWSVLYETVVLTVVDRDTRDMIFDYRITNEGIRRYHSMLAAAYWPTQVNRMSNLNSDVRTPSRHIPVLLVLSGPPAMCNREVGGRAVDVCEQVEVAVMASVRRNPGKIRVVRDASGSMGSVPQLNVYIDGRIRDSRIWPNSVEQGQVDDFIDNMISSYVDPLYIPPRTRAGGDPVPLLNALQVDGRGVSMRFSGTSRRNIAEFEWPREVVYWGYGACPQTGYRRNFFEGVMGLRRPATTTQGGAPFFPRLEIRFLGNQRATVDWYQVTALPGGKATVSPLQEIDVRLLPR